MKLRTDALSGAALVGLPALELVGGNPSSIWATAALAFLGVLLLAGLAHTCVRKSGRTR